MRQRRRALTTDLQVRIADVVDEDQRAQANESRR